MPDNDTPGGILRLSIDRNKDDVEAIDLILNSATGVDPAELSIAQTFSIKKEDLEIILYGEEIRMVRDFLNQPTVEKWI